MTASTSMMPTLGELQIAFHRGRRKQLASLKVWNTGTVPAHSGHISWQIVVATEHLEEFRLHKWLSL